MFADRLRNVAGLFIVDEIFSIGLTKFASMGIEPGTQIYNYRYIGYNLA